MEWASKFIRIGVIDVILQEEEVRWRVNHYLTVLFILQFEESTTVTIDLLFIDRLYSEKYIGVKSLTSLNVHDTYLWYDRGVTKTLWYW